MFFFSRYFSGRRFVPYFWIVSDINKTMNSDDGVEVTPMMS